MCGRFTLNQSAEALSKAFNLQQVPDLAAQYNIAPTQMVLTVLHHPSNEQYEFQQLRWGLIPSWAKDAKMGVKLINARAETVSEKPAFRASFKRRRCLVIADGFYEWQKQQSQKQPFYFRLQDGKPFGFAGLWDVWHSPEGEEIASCTIITTTANELLAPIHDRMPVILAPEDYDLWLDTQVQTPEKLQPLLDPYPVEAMTAYPVSNLVNKPQHNSPECIMPLSEENGLPNQLN
ncbi:SOS response-associated peptidase [Nostoc spongiaeforme FACHB-130]|uniref:Abasic site processing protein n=1 Tax=Nostoc spongiaeforme FACHB-130 TaxID=1357510 RepID=A0ABR8FZH5_9NOSO|nr:SOS response-associated peptidase [Nostoc spongiaeforme]MBD2595977.1 SOS response-associated peptidase [Nostoc spongiaeforme FACHB-130]